MVLRFVFFGLPLAALLLATDGHQPVSSVLSPGRAPGRRRLRRTSNAPVLEAGELGSARATELFETLRRDPPDLLVSWFWTRRLPPEWLDLPKLAAVGVHPSLLPRHRGPDPFFWAIDQGDEDTGVTAHLLEPTYDTGAVLGVQRLRIEERNAWQLARALDRPSLSLLRSIVRRYAEANPPPATAQIEAEATFAPEPDGELLAVRWHWPTERVLRRIRALAPVPGLPLELEGLCFSVVAARPAPAFVAALTPGEAELSSERGLCIRTGDGAIVVEQAMLGSNDADGEERVSGRELVRRIRQQSGRTAAGGAVFARPSEPE